MVQDFWKRESIQEWLPSISPIRKYNKEQRDSREGAIALVDTTTEMAVRTTTKVVYWIRWTFQVVKVSANEFRQFA